jgi:hypothetical protein
MGQLLVSGGVWGGSLPTYIAACLLFDKFGPGNDDRVVRSLVVVASVVDFAVVAYLAVDLVAFAAVEEVASIRGMATYEFRHFV